MKIQYLIGILLVFAIVLFSGCISVEMTETVKADGSIHRFVSMDKTGLLMNANCKSLKNLAQSSPDAKISDFENFEQVCRETDSQIIIEFDMPYGNESNPVKIIEKEDGKYLRYEAELAPLTTTKVVMPSKVTSHNGELLNENTVAFKGSDLGNSLTTYDQNQPKKTIYVESKKPEFDFLLPIVLIGGLIVIVVIIASYLLLKKKKSKGTQK